MSRLKEGEEIALVVDAVNDYYGSETYLPAEMMFQDDVWYVKAFGKVVWDSDNSEIKFCKEEVYDGIEEALKGYRDRCHKMIQEDVAAIIKDVNKPVTDTLYEVVEYLEELD